MSDWSEEISSACASHSHHLPAGEKWHLKSLFFSLLSPLTSSFPHFFQSTHRVEAQTLGVGSKGKVRRLTFSNETTGSMDT